MKRILVPLVLFVTTFYSLPLLAQQNWSSWVAELKQETVSQGVDPSLFDRLFANVQPSRQILQFDRSQPEGRLTFRKYRRTRGDPYKISLGQQNLQKHKDLLEEIGYKYKVDPCFIVALWGMESSYGNYLGDFPVIKSLATLAYGSSRSGFFRNELIYALHILNEGHVTPDKFKGEWAGASGQPQFLPSSWYKYAVDYTGNGRKDIWTNLPDTFASVANYLKQNGWSPEEPWAIQVKLPADFDEEWQGKERELLVSDWDDLGVRTAKGEALPYQNLSASVIIPDGGPNILAFNNFKVLLTYNNSIYYAGTVGHMADNICKRDNKIA
ncbi:MAG: lytic murein transglycosylase [Gammaproteobacteria bacterium]